MNPKTLAFEYLVYQLLDWYKEAFGNVEENDLSTLKVLKLLFFVTAISSKNDSESLLEIPFNNFYAMPLGHVEGDVYSDIKKNATKKVIIDKERTVILDSDFSNLDQQIQKKIDTAVKDLKLENFELIKLSSFDLVELSHSWYSWKYYFKKANSIGLYSFPIPTKVIFEEDKIFSIN